MSDDPSKPGGPEGPAAPPDAEREAKIAAATAKAAVRAAAASAGPAEAKSAEPPKPPWEDKPVPPTAADAGDDADLQALVAADPGWVLGATRFAGEVTATVPRQAILEICRFLKRERSFAFLVDLTVVDWPERAEGRFDVVYWLHRFADSRRLRLIARVPDGEPVASVSGVWRSANWMEREAYDMFGVLFAGHPNLERILTWEGFNGHPLRKDFPVEGVDTGAAIYPEVYPPGGGPPSAEEGAGS
jgi:NADH-quinone oxidoreductase subunit C